MSPDGDRPTSPREDPVPHNGMVHTVQDQGTLRDTRLHLCILRFDYNWMAVLYVSVGSLAI